MRRAPPGGTDGFYRRLLGQHGTYVGPDHGFEMPDTYVRPGYGGPTRPALAASLGGISKALRG
jgi:D-mannonate dehydratase